MLPSGVAHRGNARVDGSHRSLALKKVNAHRACTQELVLKDGRFRWRRLVNLMQESGKTLGVLPADKLWLTLDWALGPEAQHIRSVVVDVRFTLVPRAVSPQDLA